MSTTEVPGRATTDPSVVHVDMTLETVVIPVSDVDGAKASYERLGWRLDDDPGPGRVRQAVAGDHKQASWPRRSEQRDVHLRRRAGAGTQARGSRARRAREANG